MPILLKKGRKTLYFQDNRCQGCENCVNACPTGVLTMSDELNMRASYIPVVIEGKERSCIFCRRCEFACPVWAIYVGDNIIDDRHGNENNGVETGASTA
ncbi:MAG: 4Fe-4S dicluster domain-containing protein [Promethearchaeota archaeon]